MALSASDASFLIRFFFSFHFLVRHINKRNYGFWCWKHCAVYKAQKSMLYFFFYKTASCLLILTFIVLWNPSIFEFTRIADNYALRPLMASLFLSHSSTKVVGAWKSNCISVLQRALISFKWCPTWQLGNLVASNEEAAPSSWSHGSPSRCAQWQKTRPPLQVANIILNSWREWGY